MTRACACVVVAIALGGCFDPSIADPIPAIRCVLDEDCPDELVCRNERCALRGAATDSVAPGVGADSVVVEPAAASVGDELRVRFSVTEELGAPPQVFLDDTALPLVPSDAPAFEARHTITPQDAAGRGLVYATLVDLAGNDAVAALGLVRLDDTSPNLVSSTINPEVASVGDAVAVGVVADELLGSASLTWVNAAQTQSVSMPRTSLDGVRATFAGPAPPSQGFGDSYTGHVTLIDVVGNSASFEIGPLTVAP